MADLGVSGKLLDAALGWAIGTQLDALTAALEKPGNKRRLNAALNQAVANALTDVRAGQPALAAGFGRPEFLSGPAIDELSKLLAAQQPDCDALAAAYLAQSGDHLPQSHVAVFASRFVEALRGQLLAHPHLGPFVSRGDVAVVRTITTRTEELVQGLVAKLDQLGPRDPPALSPPMQIARPLAAFQGRAAAIEQLLAALTWEHHAAVCALEGMGGIGKTELARVVAERLRAATADGQIQVDLGGRPEDLLAAGRVEVPAPLTTDQAMLAVVRAFEPDARPQDAVSAYSHALTDKRIFLLLDNAAEPAQVTPLVQHAPPGCLVVVTSRQKMPPDLAPLELGLLDPAEAVALLQALLGPKATDADLLAKLAKRCGYLPLALRAAGASIHMSATRTLASFVDDLDAETDRLRRLQVRGMPDLHVAAVLGLSLRQLATDDADLLARWALLAVFPQNFDLAAVAAIWTADDVADDLDHLVARSMVRAAGEGRFELHDLMRDLAIVRPDLAETPDQRKAHTDALDRAGKRHARHYCAVLGHANQLYLEGDAKTLEGLALYDREQRHIAAGQAWAVARLQRSDEAARLAANYADAGVYVLTLRIPPRARIAWLEAQRDACDRLGDRRGEGAALGNLGLAYAALGEPRRAIEHYEQHLAIAREIGYRRGEGTALGNWADELEKLGEHREALAKAEAGLVIKEAIEDPRVERDRALVVRLRAKV